ncbi:hypothetical protein CONPUDRAFT_113580 [Coniophora puteana RWD-64-598 SS2]|uniref:Uncharacterized protein n=1 Tax=Coniophora puteana (strain RWD-64-598) TaxID=741705 RepID=R7SEQ8_CONPW|nr:uncharacterized protein CONPUDRAFT_113580 [Coniophora puteana RWD-64-598 SS2]EIW74197.1 hypothetical protein CONPUDRAFT_113580 [Coniophora puteana RWD-64-598 SS2]
MNNARGFAHVRVGHAGSPINFHHKKRASSSSCTSGGFYISPASGQTVSVSDPFSMAWDPSCLTGVSAVDIYVIAQSLSVPRIHMWQNVNNALGSYNSSLDAAWWNSTSSMDLQLSIVASGTQPFLSPFPAAPVFTATYDDTKSASYGSTGSSAVTYVNNFGGNKSLSRGKIAAGILIPLLFIGLAAAWYLKRARAKGKEKTKRFSEMVDKRMSVISNDWKAISVAGAQAAVRHSMALSSSGNRNSTFGGGSAVSSAGAVDGMHAVSMDEPRDGRIPAAHIRPGVRTSAFGDRVSRVSFAADVRPSLESRRAVVSRAFHNGFVPPVPIIPDSGVSTPGSDEMSPTQTHGAMPLNEEEIFPSLQMMHENSSGDSYLLPSPQHEQYPENHMQMPSPPAPAVTMVPAAVMSPDALLRAYAERRVTSPGPGSPGISSKPTSPAPAFPQPMHFTGPLGNGNGSGNGYGHSPNMSLGAGASAVTGASASNGGMRVLYAPTTPPPAAQLPELPFQHQQQQGMGHSAKKSSGVARFTIYDDEDAYAGTAS